MTWGNANDMINDKKQDIKFYVQYNPNFVLSKNIYIYIEKKTRICEWWDNTDFFLYQFK